jgi:phosphoribosylanthranilate isomerase
VSRVRVKICGLTRRADVRIAREAGADALGFIFADSPRRLSPADGARIVPADPCDVLRVGVFLDPAKDEVSEVLRHVPLDLLQFHGSEPEAFCGAFGLPWLKAVRVGRTGDVAAACRRWPGAQGLVLDTGGAGGAGGTGRAFDWSLATGATLPIWLAGGLTPENVGRAIRQVRPFAVDTASGVEAAPGVKDADKVRAFIAAARAEGEAAAP